MTRSRSGSGLTANRINQFNASGLYPAFNDVSCSPRPALCYRALLALPSVISLESVHSILPVARPLLVNALGALLKVTSLDPRTPHQPEKLQKLSKNDCVLHPINFWSMRKIRLYRPCFQRHARRSQADAAKTVQRGCCGIFASAASRVIHGDCLTFFVARPQPPLVKMREKCELARNWRSDDYRQVMSYPSACNI